MNVYRKYYTENNCSGKQTFLIFYLVQWKALETWIDSRQSYIILDSDYSLDSRSLICRIKE